MSLQASQREKEHEEKKIFFKTAPLNAKPENHLREPANEGNLSSWRR